MHTSNESRTITHLIPRPFLLLDASSTSSIHVSSSLSTGVAEPSTSTSNSVRAFPHAHSRSLPTSNINSPAPWSLSSSPAVTATPPSPTSLQPNTGTVRKKKKRLSSIACPACTFLNHPSLKECEICGTTLQTSGSSGSGVAGTSDSLQVHFASKSAPSSRPASPEIADSDLLDDRERYIRLSFRKGGDKSFYAALKTALQQKGWEVSLFYKLSSKE